MDKDVIINVEGVSKKFCRSIRDLMVHGSLDIARDFFSIPSKTESLRRGEFWAIRDVSFTLKRGEILGIIGSNGSGKTTLLRMLNGIYMPDVGKIEITGMVGALIAVGAGFHPLLSGRENVYVNGQILGMSKKEIDEKFDEIVEFAEIGDFIDTPVKNYSSGMFVRLGFSVAAYCDTDILLIDEVLAVGDVAFRAKSKNKMLELLNKGKTVIYVSHNMMAVEEICDNIVWLDHGEMKMSDTKDNVIPKYMMFQRQRSISGFASDKTHDDDTDLIWVTQCELLDDSENVKSEMSYAEALIIRIYYETRRAVPSPYFMVNITDHNNDVLFRANMLADGLQPEVLDGKGYLDINFGSPLFFPGVYNVRVQIRRDANTEHFTLTTVKQFNVLSTPEDYGFTGEFKGIYTYASGLLQPYKYHWSDKETLMNTKK